MEYQSYNPNVLHGTMSKLVVSYQGRRNVPLKTTTINIEGEIIEIPICMLENGNLFKSIFTKRVFYSLSIQKQQYLCKFLPRSNVKTLDEHLTNAFTSYPVFDFPSNFEKLRCKLKNKQFDPSYLKHLMEIREIKRVLFEHFYRQYNLRLMRKLFISRHEILEKATMQESGISPNTFPTPTYKVRQKERNTLKCNIPCRANIRAKRMLDQVKRLANDPNPYSSDEEDVVVKKCRNINIKSSIFNSKVSDFDLYEPYKTATIKEMLKEHKRLKECHPESPSLDTEGITLFDVYSRAGLSIQLEKNFGEQQKERINKRMKYHFFSRKMK